MHKLWIALLFISSVFSSADAWSGENERTTRSPEAVLESSACYNVNRAYEKTVSSGRYTTVIYEMQSDRAPKIHLQMRVVDQYFFAKIGDAFWTRFRRNPIRTTIDNASGLPIFTACRYQGTENINGEGASRYWAYWRRAGYEAFINIWVSGTSGKFLQTLSQYRQGHSEFGFPISRQTFDYDRDRAAGPMKP